MANYPEVFKMYRDEMAKKDELTQLYWAEICKLYGGFPKACHHSAIAMLNGVDLLKIIDYLDNILY